MPLLHAAPPPLHMRGRVTRSAAGLALLLLLSAASERAVAEPPLHPASPYLAFSGDDQYVVIPDDPITGLDGAAQASFSAWIRPIDLGHQNQGRILDKGGGSGIGSGYSLLLNPSGGLNLNVNSSIGDWSASSQPGVVSLDVWQHVAAVYDGTLGNVAFYVNGIAAGSEEMEPLTTIVGNSEELRIGIRATDQKREFHGDIDEVRIWNLARTQQEIAADMTLALTGSEAGLVGYYPLDAATGQTTADLTSNANHGSLGSTGGVDSEDPTWTLPINQPPQVNAGLDAAIILPTTSHALDAEVVDDAFPGQPLTTVWTAPGAPGPVTFGQTSAIDTTASFTTPGTYVLQLEAGDGEFNVSDSLTVAVYAAPALASIEVTPSPASVALGATRAFIATGYDQVGTPFPIAPTWNSTGGSVTATGPTSAHYTAGSSPGSFTVTALQGSISGSAVVSVTDPATTEWPTNGWATATPAEMAMDQTSLEQARDYALTGGGKGMITRRGKVVMTWGTPTNKSDLRSATKSVGVIALGLAIQDGLVAIDDAADLHLASIGLPPASNASTGWLDDITLEQLAAQTAGFENTAGYGDLLFAPGTTWRYSDGSANWLADVLTVVYGQDLETLFFDRVFSPLGITGSDLSWRTHRYRSDPIEGITRREFGSGIRATPDAMARIGYLFLRRGEWDGQQILSASFVDMARQPVPGASNLPVDETAAFGSDATAHYGLLWWNNADGTLAGVPTDAYFAYGIDDRIILVIPSLDIVASRTGSAWAGNRVPSFYTVIEPFIAHIAQSVNQPPQADAGPDATASPPQYQVTLSGAFSDDAFPGYPVTATWSVLSGPGGVSFSDPQSLAATATFSRAGVYTLVLSADDGEFAAVDITSVSVLDTLDVIGSALGGSITVAIEGHAVGITTLAGWSAAQVAAAIAVAIGADPILAALGITAVSNGNTLEVDAHISAAVSADPGIILGGVAVPGLGWPGLLLLASALLWGARSSWERRAA
ncbi:MAG: serine hydrolase [Deltaproteobacteria bacterium]|nr:serine hydrolase [Deltaproteobacteria bacterium]